MTQVVISGAPKLSAVPQEWLPCSYCGNLCPMLRNFGLMLTRAIHQGCIKALYSWRTSFIILALHEKHILISPCPPHQNQPLETGPVYGNIKITSFPMGM